MVYSSQNENPYIQGSSFIGGKYCEHCLHLGVTCRAGGVLLNDVPFGRIIAEVEGIDFEIPGKLENCKIARGLVTTEEGIALIKAISASKKQEIADEAARAALEDMKDEPTEISSNNWS